MNWDVTRTDWLAGQAWGSSPAFPAWSSIDLIIVHWVGSNGVPVSGDPARVEQTLRNMQHSWLNSKGYNLGYTGAVDWLGRRLEIRGDTARNAANAPAALNARSVSYLCLVNLDGAMTAAQDGALTDLIGQALAAAPAARLIGHRDGPQFEAGATATQCPGDVIYGRLCAGDFDPGDDQTGDDDMTPEQAAQLQAVHDALLVQNPVSEPGMSLVHQADQTHTIMRTLWDGFPGNIVDAPGVLARTIKNIAATVGAKLG